MVKPEDNDQPAPKHRTGSEELPPDSKSTRDTWDYIEILGRPVSAFITALAVASIGIFGNMALNKSNQLAQFRVEAEQDTRLYTQLLSSREQADSNLRKDMFNTILGEFLSKSDEFKDGEKNVAASLSDRLLKLELLALNFGDSLSLRPLFQEMNRDIESQAKSILRNNGENAANYFEGLFLPRLKSLARRVSDRQASLLSAGGSTFSFSATPEDAGASKDKFQNVYHWPLDEAEARWKTNTDQAEVDKETWLKQEMETIQEKEAMQTITLGEITRTYEVTLSRADFENSEVVVELTIQDISGPNISMLPLKMKFKLNFFNFPMIDNTRLTGDQRFALILKKFNKEEILIEGICFPGSYASHRDKPFLNDVIEQLRQSNEESETANDSMK